MGEETKRIENPCDENSCAALPPLQDGDEGYIQSRYTNCDSCVIHKTFRLKFMKLFQYSGSSSSPVLFFFQFSIIHISIPHRVLRSNVPIRRYLCRNHLNQHLLASDLNMYEQQSTWNPNMPLRCLLYSAHALEKYIHNTGLSAQMFLSTLVKVPTPKLVVLYNGIQEIDDMILRLSDCFEKPGGDLEATVHVYNITAGHRLPRECRPLEEYSLFVDTYRSKVSAVGPGQAADEALSALPDGRAKDYLCSQRSEVVDMLLTEYDEQAVMQAIAKDAEAKGEARGEKRGERRGIKIGEARGENRGEEKLGLLITAMMNAGESMDALARVSTDPAYRKAMYQQYGITSAVLPDEAPADK